MMKKEEVHTFTQEKVAPILHKFRMRLKKRMQEDLRKKVSKIWSEESSWKAHGKCQGES